MENPYDWPGRLQGQWSEWVKGAQLNRYPDPEAVALKSVLRQTMQIPQSSEILLGNGSDELIQILALAVAASGRSLLSPEPSFVMYGMIARIAGLNFVAANLQSDFSLDMPVMLDALRETEPVLTFIAYPNNPTGQCWPRADIERLIEAAPGLVVIDEAYEPFAQQSFLQDLPVYPNLLVMRTLSKLGLAGLRLGYLCGAPEWIAELNKIRLPYNINTLSQLSAGFALEHIEELRAQAASIRSAREALIAALNDLPIKAYPSDANFVLFRTPSGQATRIFKALLSEGVLIKNLSRPGLLADCLRVTVGRPDEQIRFLELVKKIL